MTVTNTVKYKNLSKDFKLNKLNKKNRPTIQILRKHVSQKFYRKNILSLCSQICTKV